MENKLKPNPIIERFLKYLTENEYRILTSADRLMFLPFAMELIKEGLTENDEFELKVYITPNSLKNYARFRKALLSNESETRKVALANLEEQPQLIIIHKETGAYLAIPLPAIAYLNDDLASRIFTEIPHVDSEYMLGLLAKMQKSHETTNIKDGNTISG